MLAYLDGLKVKKSYTFNLQQSRKSWLEECVLVSLRKRKGGGRREKLQILSLLLFLGPFISYLGGKKEELVLITPLPPLNPTQHQCIASHTTLSPFWARACSQLSFVALCNVSQYLLCELSCLQGPVLRSKSPCVYKHSAEASTVHVSVTTCPPHDVSVHKPCVDHPFVVILRSLGFLLFNDLFLCEYFFHCVNVARLLGLHWGVNRR